MTDSVSNNKRIAKNTIMLYIRMLLSMVVSLYTSRVVLATLGVTDFGIYGVVGGIVAMFGFLNASMSGATSRFLTFEMGKNNDVRLKETFSSAMLIHLAIAFVIFILAETIGLWFLITKLVIPEERMFAAHIVYQLSILSTMVSITQVPYNAVIISHEKMDIYAYVELLNVTLKLLIVFLLPILGNDKLIIYAVLLFIVSILITFVYRIYCARHYKESKICRIFKKDIIKPMLAFSGWDLFGNMSVTVRQQGTNLLLNIFFGPILNAASGIATTVQSVIYSFAYNIIQAFRPAIIKHYASGNMEQAFSLFFRCSLFSTYVLITIVLPLLFELPFVCSIWLVEVPDYTVSICRLILFASFFNMLVNCCNIIIHANGKIKLYSFTSGIIYLGSVALIYLVFLFVKDPLLAYYIYIFMYFLVLLLAIGIIKKLNFLFKVKNYIMKVLLPLLFYIIILFFSVLVVYNNLEVGWIRLFTLTFLSIIVGVLYLWFFLLNSEEKNIIYNRIKL